MAKTRILLVGNCVLDQVWELNNFPQQDEELRAVAKTRVLGGNACNSSQILARLGEDVEFVSSLADDATAQWILQELSRLNISTQYCIQKPGYSSAESSIWLNRLNGSRTIVHHRNLPELSVDELRKIPLNQYQWIHFEGRNIDTLLPYLTDLKALNVPVSLEIEKNRDDIELLLPFVNTVIVSSAYLKNKNLNAKQCLEVFNRYNSKLNIVCTLGASGVVGKDSFGQLITIAAKSVEKVVDTVGAGDCFIGALIHRLSRHENFESALIYANQLAARKIQYRGMKFNDD